MTQYVPESLTLQNTRQAKARCKIQRAFNKTQLCLCKQNDLAKTQFYFKASGRFFTGHTVEDQSHGSKEQGTQYEVTAL